MAIPIPENELAKDLLSTVQTCYVLPGDHLVFVTSRDLSGEYLKSMFLVLEEIFTKQRVSIVTNISHVLIKREPLVEQSDDGASVVGAIELDNRKSRTAEASGGSNSDTIN